MESAPTFRFEPSSPELTLRPSAAAQAVARQYRQKRPTAWQIKRADRVRAEARARVAEKGGDPKAPQAVLAESELQFGQYRGQTLQWLLANDVGYACSIVESHERERNSGNTTQTPLMQNKDALVSYARLFPPMVAAIDRRRMREGSRSVRGLDDTLVGMGAHGHRTFKSLYEARDPESRSYVQWLRQQKVGAGSKMHDLQSYVLARDKEQKTPEARPAHVLPRPGAASSDPAEPSDADLLAAAMEVDSPRSSRDAEPAGPPVQLSASGAELLPRAWRRTLPEEQHEWVGRALFRRTAGGKVVLRSELRLWWSPPGARLLYTQPPATAHPFFQRPFFLWLPYRMWAYHFRCPPCGGKLVGAGFYKTVRRVLDRSGWYFMGTEYLECGSCHRKVAGWSQDILEQLDMAHREQFPAVLTYKLSCDRAVIGQLKERTLGNSASRLRASLVEQHTREWMAQSMLYLSVLRKLRAPGAAPQASLALPPMHPVPGVSWLISVYVRDALTRLDETKARVTSIFGDILKMDSSKKVTKKLAGGAAGTAAWVTNVGNEHGQVLMSVLTAAEGDGLADMAAGLMRRYRAAGEAPPKVLYVDRDCCVTVGRSKTAQTFHEWHELVVRLDVWHLMRRFARGVTTDSHQLYGPFMARLSLSIFEWDAEDVARLREAKQSEEGGGAHVKLSAKELARHCRRRTRGAAETERLLREALDAFWEATDTMGVPLIDRARMEEIWSTQRRHLDCIQDPAGVELYTKTGELTKGGVKLPVYRCARGSTSLESFHLHLCRFIPGTSASDVHFQVYLLEGLVRWNENRGRAAVEGGQRSALRCYSARVQHSFDQLTRELLGRTLVDTYTQPREYTGELIGVEYLYSQTGAVLHCDLGDPDAPDGTEEAEEDWEDGDEGFVEEEAEGDIPLLEHHAALLQTAEPSGTPAAAVAEASASQSGSARPPPSRDGGGDHGMEVQQAEEEEDDVVGPDGHGGYQHVVALAHGLAELRHHAFVTQRQAREIVALWQKMSDRDKAAVTFPPRHQDRLVQGRFKTSHRRAHTPGVDSVKRAVLGQGAGAAQSPKASRLVEAVLLELCRAHSHEATTLAGVRMHRWGAVMSEYRQIRDNVLNCPTLMACTRIQLYDVNKRTLTQWHNQRSKAMMRETVAIAVPGPSAPETAAEPLPAPRTLLPKPRQPDQPLQHRLPADASGLAVTIRGPLAPELYDLVIAAASVGVSSSSSASATPATPSTSATPSGATPSTSAGAGVAAPTTAPASAAATAPAPPPPPPLLLERCHGQQHGGTDSSRRRNVVPGRKDAT
ncbi:hypothetical protein MATL_G00263900 [Megalops atlanticus]|uniref:DUF6729 domain-containing protein n=1 Tax=Megalops atlanticus TaxID=7932 RepID=A0A9D3STV5_MEGAT|nr:hypothetical protein MATL_G00263900 [Megalops atlanticus]